MDQAARLRALVKETASAPRQQDCTIIAVTSGKGGVGKTTVAVNLAVALAGMNRRVAIVDADLGLSSVDVTLGIMPKFHLGHVLDHDVSFDQVSVALANGLKVVSGGSGVERLANLSESERAYLMKKLAEFSRSFDYLIIDTSPGIGRNVMDFLAAADRVMVVTTSEPAALTDCYAAVKTIYQNMPAQAVSLLVNRAPDSSSASQVAGSIDTVLDRFMGRSFDDWSYLPEDPSAGVASHRQKALVETYSASPAAAALRKLAIRTAGMFEASEVGRV